MPPRRRPARRLGSGVRATPLRRNQIQSLVENQPDSDSRRRMPVSIISQLDGQKHAYLGLVVPGLRYPVVHPDILPFLGLGWWALPPGHSWEPFMCPIIGIINPIRYTKLWLEHQPCGVDLMLMKVFVLPEGTLKRGIDIYLSEDSVSRQVSAGISSLAPAGPGPANSGPSVFSQLQVPQPSAAEWTPYPMFPAPEPQPPQLSGVLEETNGGHSGPMWNPNPIHAEAAFADGNYPFDGLEVPGMTGGLSNNWMSPAYQDNPDDRLQ
ncbi:hypothetical protein B0T19DRAFT_92304 [Cercophora scortea]|uniref:Uncharacterized protein n=1 Tax=Cercophora scortea TaxID=314031 RepID=A0AAE0IVH4_9PEZI|nr:hypothetical protein B0T19DRAFT_92304 [Cercophora scortea]